MAMKAVDFVVGMCADCDEVKMMKKEMMHMGNAGKCDACGKALTWKK